MSDAGTTRKLSSVLDDLSESVGDTLSYFDKIDKSELNTLLKSFALLKENNDKLKDLAELISKLYQNLSYEVIPNAMEANGFDSVKLGGKNFIVSTRINASIPEDQREVGYRWLTEVAKTPELIVPRVNAQQLSSFVKTYFETHAEWPPEDAIKVHKQNYIQVRKS